MRSKEDIIRSVVYGHAVADALGVPAEFMARGELRKEPILDMEGFGAHEVPAGTWSDDTSMAIAALDVLSTEGAEHDMIMKAFMRWFENAEYTATGEVFDVGRTCLQALRSFAERGEKDATECGRGDHFSNGNGSLMRIYPYALYGLFKGLDEGKLIKLVAEGSRVTHAHPISVTGCIIYSLLLTEVIKSGGRDAVYRGLDKAKKLLSCEEALSAYERLVHGKIEELCEEEIKSSGYVVDTLEAAIWCVLTTDDYISCVLKAVNLGDDTDTVAAVAGSVAGALYGFDSIPDRWLNALRGRDVLDRICDQVAKIQK